MRHFLANVVRLNLLVTLHLNACLHACCSGGSMAFHTRILACKGCPSRKGVSCEH